MIKSRKSYSPKFKIQVVLEAVQERKTITELASEYGVHPNQISMWKKHLKESDQAVFEDKRNRANSFNSDSVLQKEIDRLNTEIDLIKENIDISKKEQKKLIDPDNKEISIGRQCELMGISRSSYYSSPKGESDENIYYMELIKEQFALKPYYGARKMTTYLRSLWHNVNYKRVRRLMILLGLRGNSYQSRIDSVR